MTDNEIIKAAEHCFLLEDCRVCPFNRGEGSASCMLNLGKSTLNLINCQKAEIERLRDYYKRYYDLVKKAKELQDDVEYARDRLLLFDEALTKAKSEAVKEFAERLKSTYTSGRRYAHPHTYILISNLLDKVDELAEELVGNT